MLCALAPGSRVGMLHAIERTGGSIGDVIRTRIMLTDIRQWQEAVRAHGEAFAEIRPAATFVQIAGFIYSDWLVETEAYCVLRRD